MSTLVFNSCDETHIFANEIGEVSIRQIVPMENDVIISIPVNHIEAVVRALRKAKREALGLGD
jgi:hypothetical protein